MDESIRGGSPFYVNVFTIFPQMIEGYCSQSILGKARENHYLQVNAHDLREFSVDRHHSVDDTPFGGGPGMVMMPEPVFRAVESTDIIRPLFLLSPGGEVFDQRKAEELAELIDSRGRRGFSLLCGRYEGVDARIEEYLTDGEISIGDYILAGGELAALVIIEAVARLLPGVLGNDESAAEESFSDTLLECAQFTKPFDFRGMAVPEVLRSGNHAKIAEWRKTSALFRTLNKRQDMLEKRGGLSRDELQLLIKYGYLSDSDN
ncbi:MAG: tRNA (guanosine(37)-N1)-methyltransferase TrmD [Firmicutes bacterium]|jgi:tRNA (guanine37-N1)-methyltransferase|nr:tRNA (guanosine(37)-N1)-methyltransferase TrmD [Bacillota bacterium]